LLLREAEQLLGESEEEEKDAETDQGVPVANPKPEAAKTAIPKAPAAEPKAKARPKEKPE
jgi:hypothetical protein